MSPRAAFRLAHGMTQDEVAARWRDLSPGEPTVKRSRIQEYEAWPNAGGRRPGVAALTMLAQIYQTSARRLLTDDEYGHYSDGERAAIDSIDYRDRDECQRPRILMSSCDNEGGYASDVKASQRSIMDRTSSGSADTSGLPALSTDTAGGSPRTSAIKNPTKDRRYIRCRPARPEWSSAAAGHCLAQDSVQICQQV